MKAFLKNACHTGADEFVVAMLSYREPDTFGISSDIKSPYRLNVL
jgi:hypothetical protein